MTYLHLHQSALTFFLCHFEQTGLVRRDAVFKLTIAVKTNKSHSVNTIHMREKKI